MTSLDVVVATRGRPASLARLLAALGGRAIVVNDGSHDDRYAAVLAAHPRARYLALTRRSGPAAARNRGAAAARGEWLVFTDDDCLPPPGWLERVAAFSDADVVGGAVELAEAEGMVARYLRDIRFIRPILAADGSALCLPTASLAVRRSWFEKVGGFDERFPDAGGEDMDLTWRLVRAGARVRVDPGWVTRHEAPAGFGDLCARYFRYGRGEALFRRLRPEAARSAAARGPRHPLDLARQAAFHLGRLC